MRLLDVLHVGREINGEERRGIAVAIAAAGNYAAGTVWPPIVQHFISTDGWRATHIGIGLFCFVTMLPLVLGLRRRIESHHSDAAAAAHPRGPVGHDGQIHQEGVGGAAG